MAGRQSNAHPFNEAGRRLYAALVSYQIGRKGVDSTLKLVPKEIDSKWSDLAERLLFDVVSSLGTNTISKAQRKN